MGKMKFNKKVWIAPEISETPELDYNKIKAIYYNGMDYMGHKTRVFAYIGFPENASKNNKVPAIVLVHGGAGMAYPQWVEKWVEKGFAAIAMDLEGNVSNSPGSYYSSKQPYDESTGYIGGPSNNALDDSITIIEDQWMYHAVSDVFLAYSLMSADERVNINKIGVCGISWGGIITCIAIGNSDCFDFAIPIYGCAYIDESKSMLGGMSSGKIKGHAGSEWITESSEWLKSSKIPTLWVNSDSDCAFSLDITSRSAQDKPESYMSIQPDLAHSHVDGWNVGESYSFADSIVKSGRWTTKITGQPTKDSRKVAFTMMPGAEIEKAYLIYRTDDIKYDIDDKSMFILADKWKQKELMISDDIIGFEVPDKAKMFYINLYDNQNNISSTHLVSVSIDNDID